MEFVLLGTGRAVPERRVSNDELAAHIDTNDEWIRSHTGIGARHITGEGEATSDLAARAARLALISSWPDIPPEESALSLDLVMVATATPDYNGCPSTACLVQNTIGAKNAAAMDISAGCTGFIYGLETASGLLAMRAGRKRALLIGADNLTKVTNWHDRSTCVLFGDGAGAVIIEKNCTPNVGSTPRGLLRTVLGADGSGAEYLIIRRGGSRNPWREGETVELPPHLEMDGHAVYRFAVKAITDTIAEILSLENIPVGEVAWIIPHQANARIVQAAAKRAGIPESKFYLNIEEYGNTSSASIPIALDELNTNGKLKRGDLVMTVGFGAGLTWGGNLIRW
jgi:3-oxoacyl-[acyl-carrier-protein] synthase-3